MNDDKHVSIKYESPHEGEEYEYTFRKQLTGQEFLDLRKAQDGSKGSDVGTYLQINLEKRLTMWTRDEILAPEKLVELPMDVYNVLYNVALRIEGDELAGANSFLTEFWTNSLGAELPTPSNGSSPSPADGSGLSSVSPESVPND